MKLFVGLGNPGKEYELTRHNVGFLVMDALALELGVSFKQEAFNASICITRINQEKVILMKPLTYMNLSGEAIARAMNYYKIPLEDLVVIYDDYDLPFKKLRLRSKGSSGTHNGMRNIVKMLGSESFKRIRIGVGTHPFMDKKDFVMSKFSESELEALRPTLKQVAMALVEVTQKPFSDVMSKYNTEYHASS